MFDRMSDSVAECVIAHELAHVHQHASGLIKNTYEDEMGADDLVHAWGFDLIGVMNWKAAQSALDEG